jgi:hypothetical protein
MVIELVYVQGFEPSATVIILFLLNARSNKPGGITVVRSIASPGKLLYKSGNCSYRRCQQNKVQYCEPNSSMAFIDGASASDSGNSYVLGTAYRNTSFVIYEKTIQSLSDSPLNLVGLYLKQQL